MILTIDTMEDGEYTRHSGGSYEAGRNGHAALLPCNPFLHQSDISLLLFGGTALRTERGFKDVVLRVSLSHNCETVIRDLDNSR